MSHSARSCDMRTTLAMTMAPTSGTAHAAPPSSSAGITSSVEPSACRSCPLTDA
eukprot:CAMPEP_0115054670 /NCGR_PEP_ID=MMETSP0227-20121206/4216_1 /TAXON_ID=89957 /ORGANISM="Polarella glacialis, Strain CCMP 1383" /LENGTH=53 /DNA_ID=CAMNT_0002439157 /DNA_START=384 /DNA_END=545 /DNA_ORIENTATION=+